MEKSKGGRPREGAMPKLMPLNMRTSPVLREKIERAAEVFGRSLTQEVERRLEQTFYSDDLLGGAHNNSFMRMALGTIAQIEARNGKTWLEDSDTYAAVRVALNRLLTLNKPTESDAERQLAEALAGEKDAHERWAEAVAALRAYEAEIAPSYRTLRSMLAPDSAVASAAPSKDDSARAEAFRAANKLTEEQELSHLQLEIEILKAATVYYKAAAARREIENPMHEAREEAVRSGREAAEDLFRLLGPKRKG